MRLVNTEYADLNIEFVENTYNVIVVESKALYSEMLFGLISQSAGHEGDFILSEDNKILAAKNNIEIIIDPFRLDFANKRIMNKLYQELCEGIQDKLYEDLGELNSFTVQLLDRAVADVEYPVNYDINTDVISLLKMYNVKLDDYSENIAERLCLYIKLMSRLCGIKLFVLANIGAFIDREDLELVYETLSYEKINVLMFESHERDWLNNETVLIIDRDKCLIRVK